MTEEQALDAFEELLDVSKTLTGPDGCPWDRSRTPDDFKSTIIEEAYEAVEAIETEEETLPEELGDLLYQVIFLARIYEKEDALTIEEVLRALVKKLVYRHSHVFGDEDVESADEAVDTWEARKRENKQQEEEEKSVLSGVPRALPALLRSYRITEKVTRAGFEWSSREEALDKIDEEFAEWKEAVHHEGEQQQKEELGDVLFSIAVAAENMNLDSEQALQDANNRFIERYQEMEKQLQSRGKTVEDASKEELLDCWNRSK